MNDDTDDSDVGDSEDEDSNGMYISNYIFVKINIRRIIQHPLQPKTFIKTITPKKRIMMMSWTMNMVCFRKHDSSENTARVKNRSTRLCLASSEQLSSDDDYGY